MNEFIFPSNTCEKSNKNGIAQPYSTLINSIGCIMIFYYLLKSKKNYIFTLFFSMLFFELFHMFSHMNHIDNIFQTKIQHFLSYCVIISILYLFYCYSNKSPNYQFIFTFIVLICFDIYSILNLNLIYYMASQSGIIFLIFFYYYRYLPKFIQTAIFQIVFLIVIILLLELNEIFNCENMLKKYPSFPFHILIETIGIIILYIICKNFSKLY